MSIYNEIIQRNKTNGSGCPGKNPGCSKLRFTTLKKIKVKKLKGTGTHATEKVMKENENPSSIDIPLTINIGQKKKETANQASTATDPSNNASSSKVHIIFISLEIVRLLFMY